MFWNFLNIYKLIYIVTSFLFSIFVDDGNNINFPFLQEYHMYTNIWQPGNFPSVVDSIFVQSYEPALLRILHSYVQKQNCDEAYALNKL